MQHSQDVEGSESLGYLPSSSCKSLAIDRIQLRTLRQETTLANASSYANPSREPWAFLAAAGDGIYSFPENSTVRSPVGAISTNG